MKCMHCSTTFHDSIKQHPIGSDADGQWTVIRHDCPACKRMNLSLVQDVFVEVRDPFSGGTIPNMVRASQNLIRPLGSARPPCPIEVPRDLKDDYLEACLVVAYSPKASAALSRRCLQNVLRDAAQVRPSDLSKEIQEVMESNKLPSHLVESIDAIRNIGNFAAHPIKSKHTGEILPVEPEEAEWNLDVLEALFDFYYVQPAIIAKKRAALDAKLKDAGKPPMK